MTTPSKKPFEFAKIIITVIVVAVVALGFFYNKKYMPALDTNTEVSQAQAQANVRALVASVGKLMLLPANEEPTVLVIDNPKEITAQQPFFIGSQEGDQVLLYPKAARAIIYSPSRNIIVNVGPITQGPATATSTAPTATPKKK